MSLKTKIQLFLLGIILHRLVGKASELAKLYPEISHDSFTRLVNSNLDSQKRLFEGMKSITDLEGGYLILDDTIFEKPYNKRIDGASWYYDRKEKRYVKGISVVVLIWTDGNKKVPLGHEIYKKGGASKVELALKLLSTARNRLKIKPKAVLFDSWYSCKAIFKRLNSYGWQFACRLKKNRLFNGKQLKKYKSNPYWCETGYLKGKIRVRVVRHRSLYFGTNRCLDRTNIMELYKLRNIIEEFFRSWKQLLSPAGCQCRSYKAQSNFFALTLLAYLAFEALRLKIGVTIYQAAQNVKLGRKKEVKFVKQWVQDVA